MKNAIKKLLLLTLLFTIATCTTEVLKSEHKYFYSQISKLSKDFYHIFEKLYITDDAKFFKDGNKEVSLIDYGFTQADIDMYSYGSINLLYAFRTALDAFNFDYNDLFYVDFDKFTLKFMRYASKSVGILGPGQFGSYLLEGITSDTVENFISEYETKINGIVEKAKAKELVDDQLKSIYQDIEAEMTYKLEQQADEDKRNFVASGYSICTGQGKCAGYARAFKACVDRLNIVNILVTGLLQAGDFLGLHLYNYVKINDYWYGFDVTVDDSFLEAGNGNTGLKYFKQEFQGMNYDHFTEGKVSQSNFEFTYPILKNKLSEDSSELNKIEKENTKITIERVQKNDGEFIKIAYDGKGFYKLKEEGIYILYGFKITSYIMEEITFAYFIEQYIEWYGFLVDDEGLYMPYDTSKEGLFINITKLAPNGTSQSPILTYTFKGTIDDIIDYKYKTLLRPDEEGYVRDPMIYEITPSNVVALSNSNLNKIKVVYDEDLKIATGKDIKITLNVEDTYAKKTCKVENVKFTAPRTLTMDFYPSKYFGGDSIVYDFYVENLVSQRTGKTVKNWRYYFKNRNTFGCPKIYGQTYDVYGKFSLLENEEVLNGAVKSSEDLANSGVNFKLALVASKLEPEENEKIDNTLKESEDGSRVKSSFAINMNLCAGQIAKLSILDGHWVKVMLPFPDGYGPEDDGIEFKAYHYLKQGDGTYKQEEIKCYVTENGLIVITTSFSPFIIAALESDGTSQNQKVIVTTENYGGKITKTDGTIESAYILTEGSISFKITPNSGYSIDTVQINQIQLIPDDNGIVSISKENCQQNTNMLIVNFIEKAKKDSDESKGYKAIIPTANKISVNLEKVTNSETYTLKANVIGNYNELDYRWYKDDVKIEGETESICSIENIKNVKKIKIKVYNRVGNSYTTAENYYSINDASTDNNNDNSGNDNENKDNSGSKYFNINKLILSFLYLCI